MDQLFKIWFVNPWSNPWSEERWLFCQVLQQPAADQPLTTTIFHSHAHVERKGGRLVPVGGKIYFLKARTKNSRQKNILRLSLILITDLKCVYQCIREWQWVPFQLLVTWFLLEIQDRKNILRLSLILFTDWSVIIWMSVSVSHSSHWPLDIHWHQHPCSHLPPNWSHRSELWLSFSFIPNLCC